MNEIILDCKPFEMVTHETGLTKCTMGLFWGAPASFLGVLQGFVQIWVQIRSPSSPIVQFETTTTQQWPKAMISSTMCR